MAHVVTFAQQKGGSGKTTILAHLADAAHEAGRSVAVADLDPQGSLGQWATMGGVDGLTVLETSSYRVGGDIRDAKRDHDLVLVDCPGAAAAVLDAALRESDLVVLPCQPTQLDVWALDPILKMCASEKVAPRVLLNRIAPRGTAADEIASGLTDRDIPVFEARIGNRAGFAKAIGAGRTVLSFSGQAKAQDEIRAVYQELRGVLDGADG